MAVITIQELQEAAIDAGTVETFSNGVPSWVTPRYGAQFPNMPKLVYDFTAAFNAAQTVRETQFNTWLDLSGFENPPLTYVNGSPLVVARVTQLIDRAGILYTVKRPASFPFTLTGTWATDAAKLVVRSDQALRQDLADPTGSRISGHVRQPLTAATDSVGRMLDAQPGSPWEKAGLVVSKPNPADPNTWDWTPAVQAMLDQGIDIVMAGGTFGIGSVTATKGKQTIVVMASATLKLLNTGLTVPAITMSGAYTVLIALGYIDGNQANRSLVSVTGDDCHVEVHRSGNIAAKASSSTYLSGIEITGNRCSVPTIHGEDYANAGQANGSVPRLLTIQGTATETRVGKVSGKNLTCAVVTGGSSGVSYIDSIEVSGCTDNGIYNGAELHVGHLVYKGSEEAVVNTNTLYLGTLFCDDARTVVGVQSAPYTHIGEIVLRNNGAAGVKAPSAILANRSGNIASGTIHIGRITGRIRPERMISMNFSGTTDYLEIGDVDLDLEYDPAVMLPTNNMADFTNVKQYSIKNWNVRVWDITDVLSATSLRYFEFPLTPSPTRACFMHNIDFTFLRMDGSIVPDASGIYIRNAAYPNVYATGQLWQGNNATVHQRTYRGGAATRDSVAAKPTAGTWRLGQILWATESVEQSPGGAKYIVNGWRCVVAGSPGTWVDLRSLTGN